MLRLHDALPAVRARISRPFRKVALGRQVASAFEAGLPGELQAPLQFLVDGKLAPEDASACAKVEAIRGRLLARAGETVDIYYSPKPGSAGTEVVDGMRPPHGDVQTFDLGRIARQTSVSKHFGQFMYLAARGARAKTIVELGACAGIASAYLASSGCERFVGIEGAADLAAIARESTAAFGDRAEIVNALFDDALDQLLPTFAGAGVDTVWIDGHHEKIATLHYFERLKPVLSHGAHVFFDDIRWSQDMLDGWNHLEATRGFSHTVDLGGIGLAIWVGGEVKPKNWDLSALGGKPQVATPHGWGAADDSRAAS